MQRDSRDCALCRRPDPDTTSKGMECLQQHHNEVGARLGASPTILLKPLCSLHRGLPNASKAIGLPVPLLPTYPKAEGLPNSSEALGLLLSPLLQIPLGRLCLLFSARGEQGPPVPTARVRPLEIWRPMQPHQLHWIHCLGERGHERELLHCWIQTKFHPVQHSNIYSGHWLTIYLREVHRIM